MQESQLNIKNVKHDFGSHLFHHQRLCVRVFLCSNEEHIKGLEFVKERAEGADMVGVGMSAGACHMCRVAGVMKGNFPLKAMVSISNPFDFWSTIDKMRGNRYEIFLTRNLLQFLIFRDPQSKQEAEIF